MHKRKNSNLFNGTLLLAAFAFWTILVRTVDVQSAGESGTQIGFSTINIRFHTLTGVHLPVYTITDWLGLVPVFVCLSFAMVGCIQLIQRKSLRKVDADILLLGLYYLLVILAYLIFERFPVNYRPILIDGRAEASYPSSTTLLVLSVMPTLSFQAERRLDSAAAKGIIRAGSTLFSLLTVTGRLICGVHWLTDIVGSVLLSAGLFCCYKGIVLFQSPGGS